MGNVFIRSKSQNSKSTNVLSRSLLSENILDQIRYLNDKLDIIDDKIWVLEAHTKANMEVMSNDIHLLNKKINEIKK
jgi:hypothetical protein